MQANARADKGKGKGKEQPAAGNAATAQGTAQTAPAGPVIGGSRGDWTAVWNADRNAYYFWNEKTNVTTWDNPFEGEAATESSSSATPSQAAATTSAGSSSTTSATATSGTPSTESKASEVPPGPTKEDFGGIDPELAYLDPTITARKPGGAPAGYTARFNARTGRFEGDPNRNPEFVSDVQRAKRQNQFFFDYENWEKSLAVQQEQAALKRANGEEDDESNKRFKPTKKELAIIKQRNKEKKEKKQKAWLLE